MTEFISAYNTQDIVTQNKPTVVDTAVLAPTTSKTKAPLKQSPVKKDGDIRAVFSVDTNSTKNYTKLINEFAIPNDARIPTGVINLLVDLSLKSTTTTTDCYICKHICDCKLLQSLKKEVSAPTNLHFLKAPNFPDIKLLDDIDLAAIASCVNKTANDTQDTYDDHIDISMDNRNNRSTNFELELEFVALDKGEQFKPKVNPPKPDDEKNFDLGDIDDIFAESSPEEQIEKNISTVENNKVDSPQAALGFFGLDSIDDIFTDSDTSINNSPEKHHLIQQPLSVTKTASEQCTEDNDDIIIISQNKDIERDSLVSVANERPLSPSLLSGTLKTKVPTSPILMTQCSQPRKFKLSTKKDTLHSSKPIQKTQAMSQELKIIEDNNNLTPSNITTKTIMTTTTDKSMFTITQLVNMINKTADDHSKGSQTFTEDFLKVEDDKSNSPILLTQADRKKNSLKKTFHTNTSLIVLESDSDSNDNDTIVYDIEDTISDQIKKAENCADASPVGGKRKLGSDGECSNASPYFIKRAKLQFNNREPLSLQENVIAALSRNKPVDKSKNEDMKVSYVLSPINCTSQKENLSPTNFLKGEEKFKENLDFLHEFRRNPKTSFADKSQGHVINRKNIRKLAFDDSDEDFVSTEYKFSQSQAKRVNRDSSVIVNHKRRKVCIHFE